MAAPAAAVGRRRWGADYGKQDAARAAMACRPCRQIVAADVHVRRGAKEDGRLEICRHDKTRQTGRSAATRGPLLQLLDEDVAELQPAAAVVLHADAALLAQDAGVLLGVLFLVVVEVGVHDLLAVELD